MLSCPNCGAPVAASSHLCAHCNVELQTIACPSCFALMFEGAKHCSQCGAAPKRSSGSELELFNCPRCRKRLRSATVGELALHECEQCAGVWLARDQFADIVQSRREELESLRAGLLDTPVKKFFVETKVEYVHCPVCTQLMNRKNFADRSGVILDICRIHGVWFDADELRRIVEFIRSGGLDLAARREADEARARRVRARTESQLPPLLAPPAPRSPLQNLIAELLAGLFDL